jgi:serine/threonine protein phosphatase PrpC
MGTQLNTVWQVFGDKACGASHIRMGMPNQDYIGWYPDQTGLGPPLILSVSDGHGNVKSFRSEIGSELAVKTGLLTLTQLLNKDPQPEDLSAIKRQLEERLPRDLVQNWQTAVELHLKERPFLEEELHLLALREGQQAVNLVLSYPLIAYGATLLVILVTQEYIAYLQLGDGDILVVSDNGVINRPLPEDERLFANQTTSLCTQNAWNDFRVGFQALVGNLPALILAATDGYSNSFRDDASFLKVGSDLLDMLRDEGITFVNKELHAWLHEASQSGSGDDISLGVICRQDALQAGEYISPERQPELE